MAHIEIYTIRICPFCIAAKRLLGEVHQLARAYGWPEATILAMSSRRRHFYLELVST